MTQYIPLRRFGLRSLYVRLPYEFVDDNGLSPGDLVLFEPEKLKIIKKSTLDTVAEPVATPEAAMASE
jgi:hypothetical protein